MTSDAQPSGHIKRPYTLAEIRSKIASHDYSAELLLQHAMLLLEAGPADALAGPVEPAAWIWQYANGEEEVVFVDIAKCGLDPTECDVPTKVTPLYTAPPATQLAQAVERARGEEREACARICEQAIDSIWEYHEENHKRTGRNVCTNLAAAIRRGKEGGHDPQ